MGDQDIIFQILWRYRRRETLSDDDLEELRLWLMESRYHEELFEDLSNTARWNKELEKKCLVDDNASMKKLRDRLAAIQKKKFHFKKNPFWRFIFRR